MIRLVLLTIFSFTFLFSNTQNISLLNDIKKVIQKEEYISLAINKYIVDNKEIPKTIDDDGNIVLDWNKLTVSDYLGTDFNKINPYTQKEMNVYFINGFAFIRGAIKTGEEYKDSHKFLYNYYVNQVNRVLTQAPKTNSSDDLLKGSFVKYDNLQKQIVKILIAYENDNTLPTINQTSTCTKDEKFYELVNSQLILKYCEETGVSFDVYSTGENLVINDEKYLDVIQAPIGAKAYVKNVTENKWYEYYYQGSVETKEWIKREITSAGDTTNTGGTTDEFGTVGVVSGEKILVLRNNIGCYLVGGDISCWGDNSFNKFGINTTTNPDADIIQTPVMLKTQLEEIPTLDDWDNSSNRVKYKALALNNQDICAISEDDKLYCSGNYSNSSVLKKMRDNTVSVAMTDTAIAIVDKNGDLYTKGVNLNGVLGINSSKNDDVLSDFFKIVSGFKEVYSLSGTRTIGALDNNKNFWIWGQRTTGDVYKPTMLVSSLLVQEIFISPSEFVLKADDSTFYRTSDKTNTSLLSLNSPISVGVLQKDNIVENMYTDINNSIFSSIGNLTCKNLDETTCTSQEDTIFSNAINILKNSSNSVSVYQSNLLDTVPEEPNIIFEDQKAIQEWDLVGGNGNNSSVQCEYEQKDNNVSPYLRCGIKKNSNETDAIVERVFEFGSQYSNAKINISMDMYEIDDWDKDTFFVKVNNQTVINARLTNDNNNSNEDESEGKVLSFNLDDSSNAIDELHKFSGISKLDENGDLKLEIGTIFDSEKFDDASFGVDNINVKFYSKPIENEDGDDIDLSLSQKEFYCSVFEDKGNFKLYCWGHIDKSIPILSTSLINDSKISQLNNYFYNSTDEFYNQKTYDEYFNMGEVFLKYPTYISGFDYDFKFR